MSRPVPSGVQAWSGLLARLVVGGVWIWAGAIKLPEPAQSVAAVRAYQLLPASVVPTVGQLLPVVEVVVGVCLVVGVLTRGAGVLSAIMLAAFVVGISSVWARGIEIDCGCFGGGGTQAGASSAYPWEIARDVGLLLASAWVVWLPRTRLALDSVLFARSDPVDLDADADLDPDLDADDDIDADPTSGPAPGKITEGV